MRKQVKDNVSWVGYLDWELETFHWPDSMATYMTGDILFSMDVFGQHFAIEELFNDKANQALLYKEAMKYFANILNPFAPFVTRKLAEIGKLNLPIDIIAPAHGVIWRDNPAVTESAVKCNWNPEASDYAAVAPMVTELLS